MTDPSAHSQFDLVALDQEHAQGRPEGQDVAAFHVLYQAHVAYLWNTLRRLGVHERDLEDVAHDVLLRVYRNMSQYDPARPLRPWLFGFAFRVASDYRRRAQHRREVVGIETGERVAEHASPDEQLAQKQARAVVLQALQSVKLERRAVFLLHDLDGFAVPEIARSLSIPTNTAYSRLRLARGEFAAAVKRIRLRRGAA